MIKNFFFPFFSFLLFAVLAFSCAEEVEMTDREFEERRIAAHVKVNYNDTLSRTALGAYYYTLRKGSGPAMPEDTGYVFVRQNTYNFDYDLTATSYETTAKQLGIFSRNKYYGPLLWRYGFGTNMIGIEEVLQTMRVGEIKRIILPSWLSGYTENASYTENTTPAVYDIEVTGCGIDLDQYQIDTLESFRDRFYPGTDSLKRGFYLKTLTEGGGDTIKTNNTVSIWYIGRFLDGHIFDTNIADTATFYGLSTSSTRLFSVKVLADEDIKDDTENKSIAGIRHALMNMRVGETAVCFFHSDYGYGAEGSSSQHDKYYNAHKAHSDIQRSMPLCFWIQVPEQDIEDEEE